MVFFLLNAQYYHSGHMISIQTAIFCNQNHKAKHVKGSAMKETKGIECIIQLYKLYALC